MCDPGINCSCLPETPVSRRTALRHSAEAVALQKAAGFTEPALKRARLATSHARDENPALLAPSGHQGECFGDAELGDRPLIGNLLDDESSGIQPAPIPIKNINEASISLNLSREVISPNSMESPSPNDEGHTSDFSSSCDDNADDESLCESEISHGSNDANHFNLERLKESSQQWRDLILWQDRHHITRPAMDDLLRILSSTGHFPLTTWQTVRNHLQRASGLVSKHVSTVEKVPYCAGHMLLNRPGPAESAFMKAHVSSVCLYCPQVKPSGMFETLPIAPRISALWKNKKGREMLLETATIREKQMKDAEDHGLYEDVSSGAVYRELVSKLGGAAAVRHDIFLVFSTDGFQVYDTGKETDTIVAALCLNFPPDVRYMINNMITIAVVPGPNEPKNLESFLV